MILTPINTRILILKTGISNKKETFGGFIDERKYCKRIMAFGIIERKKSK